MKYERISPDGVFGDSQQTNRSPSWLVAIPFFVLGVCFSLWFLEAYYAGDSIFYRNFYEALFDMPTEHWADLQRRHLGSSEPLYRYALGVGAYLGWDRVTYLSAWNGILVAATGYVLIKYRCSAIFCCLVLTNFYLLVLLGSAERLKFAYVLLVLSFAFEDRRVKFLFAASSPFFHTQAVVQFVSAISYYLVSNLKDLAKTPLKTLGLALIGSVAIGGIAYLFLNAVGQSIESKSAYYAGESLGLTEGAQWFLILGFGLLVFRDRLAYFVAMIPMGVLTVLFGNRVNVATLVLFAGLAILQRKTQHPIVLTVMAYMSFKSIQFISDVVRYGDGFAGG